MSAPENITRTTVGIVGGGPAGLLLSHLLSQQGIENVVLEKRDHETIANTHRAGILEQQAVTMLTDTGVDGRVLTEGDEPVHPRDPAAGQYRGAQGDEDTGAALARDGVVAVCGGDRPHDRGHDQHEHRDDQHERQQRTDHRTEVTDAAEPVEVREHVHHAAPAFTVMWRWS